MTSLLGLCLSRSSPRHVSVPQGKQYNDHKRHPQFYGLGTSPVHDGSSGDLWRAHPPVNNADIGDDTIREELAHSCEGVSFRSDCDPAGQLPRIQDRERTEIVHSTVQDREHLGAGIFICSQK